MNAKGESRGQERSVSVSRSDDGTLGGAMLWLSLDDLAELGIEPEAEEVAYVVEDGRLHVRPGGAADG